MRIKKRDYDFWVEQQDLDSIREAIRLWGKSHDVVNGFDGSRLHGYIEAWEQFVKTYWSGWDSAEYNHDKACRIWIQIAIEYSCPATSERIQKAVSPMDSIFIRNMKSAVYVSGATAILKSHPYFWETHTIHPDLIA